MAEKCKAKDARIEKIVSLYEKSLGRGIQDFERQSDTSFIFRVVWGEEDYEIGIILHFHTIGKNLRLFVGIEHEYRFETDKKEGEEKTVDEELRSLEYKDYFSKDDDGCDYAINSVEIEEVETDIVMATINVYRRSEIEMDIPDEIDDKFIDKMESEILEFSNGLWRAMNEKIERHVKAE